MDPQIHYKCYICLKLTDDRPSNCDYKCLFLFATFKYWLTSILLQIFALIHCSVASEAIHHLGRLRKCASV